MPQVKPGIATTILMPEPAGEGFVEISPNKTLFIQQLTNEAPDSPQVVEGLETVEKVYDHFKPNCDVTLVKEDGSPTKENFKFGNLGDFDVKSLTSQSPYLRNLSLENDAYLHIMKQLKMNRSLKTVIENPETNRAFVNALRALASQLEAADEA